MPPVRRLPPAGRAVQWESLRSSCGQLLTNAYQELQQSDDGLELLDEQSAIVFGTLRIEKMPSLDWLKNETQDPVLGFAIR
jgi:hypothetical protein